MRNTGTITDLPQIIIAGSSLMRNNKGTSFKGNAFSCQSYTSGSYRKIKPSHEIMALFVLRKLILQTRMHSHPVEQDVWFLVGLFLYFICANSEGFGKTARMRRLAWAFAGRNCDKYPGSLLFFFLSRVVNVGTSSKMCQRNFVPTPHPGTLEIVPTLRNE